MFQRLGKGNPVSRGHIVVSAVFNEQYFVVQIYTPDPLRAPFESAYDVVDIDWTFLSRNVDMLPQPLNNSFHSRASEGPTHVIRHWYSALHAQTLGANSLGGCSNKESRIFSSRQKFWLLVRGSPTFVGFNLPRDGPLSLRPRLGPVI
jgi:hypothetical protein